MKGNLKTLVTLLDGNNLSLSDYDSLIKEIEIKKDLLNSSLMNKIKQIRCDLGITQKEVADFLKVNIRTYQRLEKTDCQRKKEILDFFIKYEHKDKFLGLGVARLSKELNINKGNLSVYMRSGKEIKGLDQALEKRKKEISDLKVECMLLYCKC